jgi:hypothetical protein
MSASAAFRRARPGSLTIDAASAQSRTAGHAQSEAPNGGHEQSSDVAGSGSATTPLALTASPLPSVPASGSLPSVATTPKSAGPSPSLSSFQRQVWLTSCFPTRMEYTIATLCVNNLPLLEVSSFPDVDI